MYQDTEGRTIPVIVKDIKNSVHSTAIDINNNKMLFTEIVCFEQLMKNMLRRLPKDKFMENALKMRRCLRRVTLMSSMEKLETITNKLNIAHSTSLLFNEWIKDILLNLKGTTHLLAQTMHYCQQSFSFLLQKLKVGHLLDSLVMSMGVLSRIYVLCNCTVINICQQYEGIVNILHNEQKEADTIMESFGLPVSLIDSLGKETNIILNRSFKSKRELKLLDQMYENDDNGNLLPSEDIGEPVPRGKSETKNSSAKINELRRDLAKIKTLKALRKLCKKFLSQTSVYAAMLSQPLSLHQCKKIKRIIKKTANEIKNSKSNRDFNKQHVINSAAVEVFNVVILS